MQAQGHFAGSGESQPLVCAATARCTYDVTTGLG